MSGSMNKVILIGNLGKDPEIRYSSDGAGKFATFSVATSEVWNDKASGEKKEKTEWNSIVVFNERIAELCEKYLKKGTKVYLEGQLQTRKWTDQQGIERYKTEIIIPKYKGELILLGARPNSEDRSEDQADVWGRIATQQSSPIPRSQEILNDEVPF